MTTIFETTSFRSLPKSKNIESKKIYKILIVDDDKNIAEIFKDILSIRGHDVTIITECMSCINKCQNIHYDIIFMDFHMVNLNGVDLTHLLKNACTNKSIVFAFTGDDSSNALGQFKEIGMDGAIIKPIDIDVISKLMNSLEIRSDIDKRIIKIPNKHQFKRHLFIF